jgi:hypothetical protein
MDLVLRTVFVFILILVVTRAVGRRELSSMEPFDLILLVAIGLVGRQPGVGVGLQYRALQEVTKLCLGARSHVGHVQLSLAHLDLAPRMAVALQAEDNIAERIRRLATQRDAQASGSDLRGRPVDLDRRAHTPRIPAWLSAHAARDTSLADATDEFPGSGVSTPAHDATKDPR